MGKGIMNAVKMTLLTCFIVLLGVGSNKLTVEATGFNVNIQNCVISGDTVNVVANTVTAPASDDGIYYLFDSKMYEPNITASYSAALPQAATVTFSVPLNLNQANSKLTSKFAVAVLSGGQYVQVSEVSYITNPEAVATNTVAYPTGAGIKGLLVDSAKLTTNELETLGVKQASYNIPVANLIGPTTNSAYPTINYEYNGKTYQFNGLVVAEYDNIFNILSKKGIVISAVLLNNFDANHAYLLHPLSRGAVSNYYMFNTAEQAGADTLEALGHFLAVRYSGKVSNWIVGNEVTAREQWNYIAYMDVASYAEEYAKSVRLFYNAIKSANANAKVFIGIDQQWDRNNANELNSYDGRDLLDNFNARIAATGNIDWSVSAHPYPVPLTWAKFWELTPEYANQNLVRDTADSPYLTIQNVHVLTDYLQQPHMLNPYGQVRSVILSEVGFTSFQGEDIQAAAFAYGYLIAANNHYISALIINRETDSYEEIAQGLAMGICNPDGSHKLIYDVFKNIDGPNGLAYAEFAKPYVGISDWSQVITPR